MTKKTHKGVWIAVLALSVLCAAGCIAYFAVMQQQANSMKRLASEVAVSSNSQNSSKTNYVEPPVNFVELKKKNSEIYAWINIPGTVIDYPVLQNKDDNGYYLTHTVEGKRSAYGSIYTENYNSADFEDFNTVIYGHNMRNGTMFGQLKKYRDKTFFEKNPYINVYMPGRIMKYRIFAAYVTDDRHIMLSYDFSDNAVRREYINSIFSVRKISANINGDVSLTESDKIITLSTCTGNDDQRYLVQGVKIYDSKDQ